MCIQCQICQEEFLNLQVFSFHLKNKHHVSSREYYEKYVNQNKTNCIVCGSQTRFINIEKGFSPYCSVSCANKDPKKKDRIIDKIKATYGEEYTNPSQVPEIITKKKRTLMSNYSVESPLQNSEIKDKFKKTNTQRYGSEYPMSNELISLKSKKEIKRKYGVESIMKLDTFKEKAKNTCLDKYGVCYASQNSKIKDKMRNVSITRSFYNLLNSDRLKNRYKPLFSLDDFSGLDNYKSYPWLCLACQTKFDSHADNGFLPRCPTCNPINKFQSAYENEIFHFLKSLNLDVVQNNRSILSGMEIDLIVEDYRLGIEMDGLFWHSEVHGGKESMYHLKKYKKCLENGIKLIHVFEDEWLYKRDIIESILKSKLGIIQEKIFARKCLVKKLSEHVVQDFLSENHIQGCTPHRVAYGLYYNEQLVSLISLGVPRYNKKYEWEIIRFCNKKNCCVVGGFSKLFSHFKKECNATSVITYSDLRFGDGNVYTHSGFEFLMQTKPSYYYVDFNKFKRYNRQLYQKHMLKNKLEIFDDNLSEWVNMKLNGYDRIWDCGNNVYVWTNK